MAKYAVIRLKGQQFKVSEGDEILVGKLGDDKPEADVLLVVDEGPTKALQSGRASKVKVGKPKVTGVKIKIKILETEVKGKKLYVQKYKAKSRYRRKYGFRPVYSRLLVEKIS